MMTYVLCALYCASTICAIATGKGAAAARALIDGAQAAINFALGISGAICFWSGLCELMERCGAVRIIAKLLHPALKRLFPFASKDLDTMSALTENVSANILGLGNAATPAGIRAAKAIADQGCIEELCMLVVLNTASIQLIPSTIAAVRQTAGAAAPFDILPAIWFSSLVSLSVALIAAKIFRRFWK